MTQHPAPPPLKFKRKPKPDVFVDAPPLPSAGALSGAVVWLTVATVLGALRLSPDAPEIFALISVVCAAVGVFYLSIGVKRYAAHADAAALRAWIAEQSD